MANEFTLEDTKTQAEITKLVADTMKIVAETNKLRRENFYYPLIVGATATAAIVAGVKIFL